MPAPEEDVDSVEDAQDGEPPSDRVDDDLLAPRGKLEDDCAHKQEVDQRPDPEGDGCGSEVSLLGRGVHVVGSGDRVHIGPEREEEDNNVDDLMVSSCRSVLEGKGGSP